MLRKRVFSRASPRIGAEKLEPPLVSTWTSTTSRAALLSPTSAAGFCSQFLQVSSIFRTSGVQLASFSSTSVLLREKKAGAIQGERCVKSGRLVKTTVLNEEASSDDDDSILRAWIEKHFTLREEVMTNGGGTETKMRKRRNNKLPTTGSEHNQIFSATCKHTGIELANQRWPEFAAGELIAKSATRKNSRSSSRNSLNKNNSKVFRHLVEKVGLKFPSSLSAATKKELLLLLQQVPNAKTSKRKTKNDELHDDQHKIPDWSYDESFYNSLVDGLGMEIRTDPVKGKGLFATKFFKSGDTILSEPALCCVQDVEEYKNEAEVCAHCLVSLESPKDIVSRCTNNKSLGKSLPLIDAFRNGREDRYIYCRNHGSHEAEKKMNMNALGGIGCREVYCSERCASAAWKQYHYMMCPGRMGKERREVYNKFLDKSWEQGGVDFSDAHFFALKFIAMVLTRRRLQKLPIEHCFAPVAQLIRVPLDRFHLNFMQEEDNEQRDQSSTLRSKKKQEDQERDRKYKNFLRFMNQPKEDPLYVENQEGKPKSAMVDEAWSMICEMFDISPEEKKFLTRDRWSELLGAVMLNAQERSPDSPYSEYVEYLKLMKGAAAANKLEKKLGGKEIIDKCWISSKGQGIYTIGACFNHSCIPNVEIHHTPENDESIAAVAAMDILPGEEMTISYLGTGVHWKERRQHLFEHYHFDCMCPLCKEEQQQREQ